MLVLFLVGCAARNAVANDDLAASCAQANQINSLSRLVEYLGEPTLVGLDKRVSVLGGQYQVEYFVGDFVGARASWAVPEAPGSQFVLHSLELSGGGSSLYAHSWLGLSRTELKSTLGTPIADAPDALLFACPPGGDSTTDVAVQFRDNRAALVAFQLYAD